MGYLASAKLTGYPEFICAVVKAMLAAPDPYHQHGESRLIGSDDVARMSGKGRETCQEATEFMRDAKKWLQQITTLDENTAIKLHDEMQVNMVMHALGQKCKHRVNHTSLMGVYANFVDNVKSEISKKRPSMLKGVPRSRLRTNQQH